MRDSEVYNFFFNDTATTEIYTLSLHDALPICPSEDWHLYDPARRMPWKRIPGVDWRTDTVRWSTVEAPVGGLVSPDRKSTRLNSSHANISYAVFCLKK